MSAGEGGTRAAVANLWVDPTGGSCLRALPQPYSDGRACDSLRAADELARSGDRIVVRGGVYPDPQLLTRNGPTIIIENASGETPRFTSPEGIAIDAPAANLTLRGLSTPRITIGANCSDTELNCGLRARDIRLEDLDVNSFEIKYVDGLRWIGGDVGPADATAGFGHPWIDAAASTWVPKNILIEHVYFHDVFSGESGTHTECLLITSGSNVIVRNNRFKNCHSTGSLYITKINLPDADLTYCAGILIENNMFLGRDDNSGDFVHFEDDCEITIRNNSFSRDARPYFLRWEQNPGNGPTQSVTVENNYGNGPVGCVSLPINFQFHHNVWLKIKCRASDVSVSKLDFVNAAADLHLTPKANAIDKGWKESYPARDIDGQRRYFGAAPDAGVDERTEPSSGKCSPASKASMPRRCPLRKGPR